MAAAGARPRVLVIRGGAIGDFILTLPAIQLLRASIAGAHVEVLGYKPIIELALAAGAADEIRSLEHASMARLFAPQAPAEGPLADYFRSFNLVVSYLYDPDGHFRGNMERLGVRTYLECAHRVIPGEGHATAQLARPLERLAMYLEDEAPRIAVETPGDCPTEGLVIAVHPGSGSLRKNWPTSHWIQSGRELVSKYPAARLALITGEAEHERGITAALRDGWQGLDVLHWDQLPLTGLAGRLGGAAAFLGHDSGISHLAAACGVPSLLLFGPTDPDTWAPRNAGVQVFHEPDGDLARLPLAAGLAEFQRFLDSLGLKSHVSPL